MRAIIKIGSAYLFFTLCFVIAQAQTPTFTTDDVITTTPAAPVKEVKENNKAAKETANAKSAAESVPKDNKESPAKPEKNELSETKAGADEKAWNERLAKKQAQLDDLTRRANQAELQIVEQKNSLQDGTGRTTSERDQVLEKIGELSKQMTALRAQAASAQTELNAINSEGKVHNYKIIDPFSAAESGGDRSSKDKNRKASIAQEIRDAQTQIQVLELRLNNNQAETRKSGNGDNFSLNRLRVEKDNLLSEIEKNRSKIEELNRKLQTLR